MSESSKVLPSEWVVRLFSRFQAIYGNRVQTMWGQADPDEVQQVWADGLGGYEGTDLRMALEACRFAYKEFPPTLFQFADLCRDAARRRTQLAGRLDGPRRGGTPIDAEVLSHIHTFTENMRKRVRDPRNWARRILKRELDGERVPMIALRMAHEALGEHNNESGSSHATRPQSHNPPPD